MAKSKKDLCWSYLLHIGYNMWAEEGNTDPRCFSTSSRTLRFDMDTYNTIIDKLCEAGVNTVVLDLGEGIKYESHPEIAVEGAWSVDFLKAELKKLRERGITPIPKLNFATTHDEWMGIYCRMVSTPQYYTLCADLIKEVCEIFDHPQYFHIGMDEEDLDCQLEYQYVVIRQHDLWWHDLKFLVDAVKAEGATPIMWSDMGRYYPDFEERIDHDIIQNNWYYWNYWQDVDAHFTEPVKAEELTEARLEHHNKFVDLFARFDKAGLKQLPAGSTWNNEYNFENLIRFSNKVISDDNLIGFMQTLWEPTTKEKLDNHIHCIENMKAAMDKYEILD